MNNLLLFFAIPIAVIIISIALQKIIRNPFLVAAIIFAIFLIVAFLQTDILTFLIATIVYTIISYVTAVLTCFITKIIKRLCEGDRVRENSCCPNNCCSNNSYINNDQAGTTETIDVNSGIFQNTNGRLNDYYRYHRR